MELDADWFVDMAAQLSVIYQQKKLHGHIEILNILRNSSKCFTKFQIFYEIPKFIFRIHEFFSKNKKYFAKFEKNLQKTKKFRKKSAKNKTHVFPMGKTKNILQNFVKIQKNFVKLKNILKKFKNISKKFKNIYKNPNEL